MGVYGFGLIGAFMFAGCLLGNLLGNALGLGSDVGGVGFSMVFLILFQIWLEKKGKTLNKATEGASSSFPAFTSRWWWPCP
jgi:malonate transporter MadL subunit